MAQSKTRHAANVTDCDNSNSELQLKDYQTPPFNASEYATLWIARRFYLPMPAARLITALSGLGGCA